MASLIIRAHKKAQASLLSFKRLFSGRIDWTVLFITTARGKAEQYSESSTERLTGIS